MNSAGDTLERIVPAEVDAEDKFEHSSLQLHYERYKFATEYLKPGKILDIACGVGYGSHFLVDRCYDKIDEVVAVDISEDAIAFAKKHYPDPKISFWVADALQFDNSRKFNTIISLETIEHLADPSWFVKNITQMLVPGGILVMSAPITPSTDGNPFHLHNFSANSFRKLFKSNMFREIASLNQVQSFTRSEIFSNVHGGRRSVRKNLFLYYFLHPNVLWLRLRSLVVDGMTNKYLVLALEKV